MENTKFSASTMGTYGYWLETYYSEENYAAWNIAGTSNCSDVSGTSAREGVRPAIEILKERIEY